MERPSRKIGILEKRVGRLRGAIKAGEGTAKVRKAAEAVRTAALAVIKAKLVIAASYPGQPGAAMLNADAERWRELPVESIVEKYRRSH